MKNSLLISKLNSSNNQQAFEYDTSKNARQAYLSTIENNEPEPVYDRLYKQANH